MTDEREAPSYIDAADRIGASLIAKQSRGFNETEARMVIELAQVEATERLAEAMERLAEATQIQAQAIGAAIYQVINRAEQGGADLEQQQPPQAPPEESGPDADDG